MDTLTGVAVREGEAALSAVPTAVNQMQRLVDSSFAYTSLRTVESGFASAVSKSQGIPSENEEMTKLVSSVRDEVTQALNVLLSLKRWIRVQVPKIEDGNNFGVSVQLDTVKAIDELLAPLMKALDDLPNYFEKRAGAWEKFCKKTSKETKTSTSESKETGGKEGASNKTSDSSSSEEKQSENSSPPDAVLHIVALDLRWYVSLHHTLIGARDAVVLTADMIEKNMEKLRRPKGTNTQGGGMYSF